MPCPSRLAPLALAAALAPTPGCELLQSLYEQPIDVPVPLETPAAELDATAQVESVEETLCSDEGSYDCAIVQALDRYDDDQVGDPPRIPEEFPIEITVKNPATGDDEAVNVEEWVQEAGLAEGIELAQAVPVDLRTAVGVQDTSAVEAVSFRDVKLNWQENTFTFNTVPLDLYVYTEALPSLGDAQRLITDGSAQKVGTIPAQEAEATGEVDVQFVAGGEDLFGEALKALRFTLIVALPEDAPLGLNDGAEAGTKRKPLGIAKVSLKAELVYSVSAAEIISQIDEATAE